MKKILIFTIVFYLLSLNVKAQRIKGDTLVITDTAIHFIKIGEQTFFIKRTITLEMIQPYSLTRLFFGSGVGTKTLLPSKTYTLPTIQ